MTLNIVTCLYIGHLSTVVTGLVSPGWSLYTCLTVFNFPINPIWPRQNSYLVNGSFELGLDLAEVVDLLLLLSQTVQGLVVLLVQGRLLLGQLGDHVVLSGEVVVQRADLGVPLFLLLIGL